MTTPDKLNERVRDAFDSIHVPDEVNQATLAALQAYAEQNASLPSHDQTHLGHSVPMATPVPTTQRKKASSHRWLALAACLVFAVMLVGGLGVWNNPTALLDIDINPSLSLKVNCFNYVIGAEALNDDAQAVLDETSVVGMPCEEALATLASSQAFARYVSEHASAEVSIASEDESQSNQLCSWAQEVFAPLFSNVTNTHVTFEEMQVAHGHCMGAGKYRAACQLMELDDAATLESCSQMSMSELHECINQCERRRAGWGADDLAEYQDATQDSSSGAEGTACENDGHGEGNGQGMRHQNGQGRHHRENVSG